MSVRQTVLFLTVGLILSACEGPAGPEGPAGAAGEVKALIITVEAKHYTLCNPYWATIFFEEPEPDAESAVIWISYENDNGLYQSIESLGTVYFDGILFATGECGYDGREGFAVLIYDYSRQLLGRTVKIQYIA